MALTKDDVIEALRQVEDPELGMDIVDLGLMYDVTVDGPKVHVLFTLTSMGCPVGPMIEQQIEEVTRALPGVEEVETELTWDPPWSPEKMSDDAKFILGFGERERAEPKPRPPKEAAYCAGDVVPTVPGVSYPRSISSSSSSVP